MKKTLLLLLTLGLVAPSLKAQDVTPLTYSEVIQVDGVSKDELYNRAKKWFSSAYRDANKVIKDESKSDGSITAKAKMLYNSGVLSGSAITEGAISYDITIAARDGRYKYVISNFIHTPFDNELYGNFGLITTSEEAPKVKLKLGTTNGWRKKVWNDIKKQIDEYTPALIEDMKSGMNKAAPTEEDW